MQLPYTPAIGLLYIYSKERLCPHKNLYTNFYSILIYNSQKKKNLKTIQMSFNKWVIKKNWYFYTKEHYSAIKRNKLDKNNNLDKRAENHAERKKKSTTKGYLLCDSIYRTFFKWKNYRNGEQISDCQRLRSGWERKKANMAIKRQLEESLWSQKSSVSSLLSMSISWL